MKIEQECKVPVPDRERLSARLQALGARDLGEVFERNWVLDTPDRSLAEKHMLLRVRTEGEDGRALLTVKKPLPDGRFKRRQEIELTAESYGAALLLLESLGYRVDWYYEKRRRQWEHRDCHIALDELPEIGCYVEIEGSTEEQIADILRQLDLDPDRHVSGNYRSLFADHLGQPYESLRPMAFHDPSCDAGHAPSD